MRDATWKMRAEHVTRFFYPDQARSSYNEIRKVPQTTNRQTVLDARIRTTPAAPQYTYWDYWGSQVVAFNVDSPHSELVISGSALVETRTGVDPPDCAWDDMAGSRPRYSELLAPSRYALPGGPLTEIARSVRRATPVATVQAACDWVHGSLEYVPGATNVHTSAIEAFEAGRGVCQDFAHLTLSLLRTCGVPARYVSGYLHPDPHAAVGAVVSGESHAWVEAWVNDWWGWDPTNDIEIGLRHIVVAKGRDYADVAPVRGVYAGKGDRESSVSVKLTRTT